MATDLERLVVQLSADIKGYQSEMQRAAGITNRQARAIEARWKQSDRNLNAIGANMAKGLIAPLTGVAAALTTREVLSYADAWTKAKNSLAVSGVVGAEQAAVLDQLYKSAQANSAPIGELASVYGKASQAQKELGASSSDLIKFTDGVAVALRVGGADMETARGALLQLGQALGSARVMAEEYNSINEGARPILIAVANGLNAAGGSVAKLKQLVNDGKVSNREFFQSFLKGLPTIQAMAANAAQTVEQGMTRVTNAMTKYIGESNESLGATQRLVAGLNALADNFGATADIVLKVAGVIAASLVGRALGGMIASLGTAGVAIASFVKAIRAAATVTSVGTAILGLSAAAGPIGLVMGAAAGAILLFNTSTAKATPGAQLLSQAIARVEADAKRATDQVRELSGELKNAQVNSLTASITEGRSQIATATGDISNLFAKMLDNLRFGLRRSFSADIVDQFEDIRKAFGSGQASAGEVKTKLEALAKVDPKFQRIVDEFAPLLDVIEKTSIAVKALEKDLSVVTAPEVQMEGPAKAYYAGQKAAQAFLTEESRRAALSKDQLALEKEIADVRERAAKAGAPLTDKQARDQAQANLDAEKRRSAEGKKTPLDTGYRLDEDINQVKARTAALAQEAQIVGLSVAEQEKRRVALDLEQQALSELRKEAQQKGVDDLDSIKLSEEQRAKIDAVATAYGRQAAATELAQQQQQRLHDLQQQFGSLAEDAILGLVDGTKDLNDVLADTLKLMAQMLLKSALLGEGPLGSGGGGLLGAVTKGLTGALSGGTTGWYATGGYTGAGGRYDPAGVVHRGEVVWSQDDIRRAGGVAVVEAMRRGAKGYASGGPVSMPSMAARGLTLPKIQPAARGAAMTFAPSTTIDARGSQMGEAQFRAILAENNRMLMKQMPAAVEKARGRLPTNQRT